MLKYLVFLGKPQKRFNFFPYLKQQKRNCLFLEKYIRQTLKKKV